MLSVFELATLLLTLSALFGWINLRWIRLPHTIGLLLISLGSSLALLALEAVVPHFEVTARLQAAIGQIDFYETIMNGLLAFLLFAGALHVDFNKMKDQKWPITFMATVGVVISTLAIGVTVWLVADLIGLPIPLSWAFVFGALISPTDPVAVLSLLKTVDVPESLKVRIAGESLFNDGVAVVAFTLLVAVAVTSDTADLSPWHIAKLFIYEGGGGIALGFISGMIAVRLMMSIDDYAVEVLITIALCSLTYAVCLRLHISGPIAVVVAGLLIGNRGARMAMSEKVRGYIFAFWEVIDEVLNSVLFLLIGLEVLVLSFDLTHAWLMLAAIPIVLAGRLVSVASPILLSPVRQSFGPGVVPMMTWGGLRGGVSVALALSLPASEYKDELLAATYAVVIFTIVVQGLTVKYVIRRWFAPELV